MLLGTLSYRFGVGDEFVVSGIRFGGSCGDPPPVLLTAAVPPYELEITLLRDGKFELNFVDSENELSDSLTFDQVDEAKRAAMELTGSTAINWMLPLRPIG